MVDPSILEVLAIREALALAHDLYAHHIFVSSDCKLIVEEIKNRSSVTYGPVIIEIKVTSLDFAFSIFSHEFKISNVETHNLIKHDFLLGAVHHVLVRPTKDLLFIL